MDIEKAKALLDKSSKFHLQVDREPNDFDIAIQTVLNELDNKDKIIIAMAEQLTTPVHGIDWVIDYFTKKVEGK